MDGFKQIRITSFLIMILIYLLATICGIWVYRLLDFDWWLNLLIADVAATVLTFIFSAYLNNASVYDPYWSVQPIVILYAFAIGKELTIGRILMLVAVSLWGIRLTTNWAYTFHGLNHQDWRYTMLKEKTGVFYPFINFTGIHMVPTLIVYGCTLPAVYVFVNDCSWNNISILFFCLSIGAMVLQGTADYQMHRFRARKQGGFIRDGLWKYSRHPNYLGEILMWWGVALALIASVPSAWYLGWGALANTILFLTVSIPLADGRQSRKPDFAEYKRATRMLLPIKK